MNNGIHWKPNDWIRLAGLTGAFAVFGIGAWMLFQGISAEGVVDLKSSVLSGTIKASSAGLYMCFFALFIIVIVLATLLTPSNGPASGAKPRAHRLMSVFWGLLAGLGLCAVGIALTEGSARTGFMMAIGALVVPLVIVVSALVSMTAEGNA
jgi:hypothetical protein